MCFESVSGTGSHVSTLDNLINARYMVVDLLDKMRALRTTFDEHMIAGIQADMEFQNKNIIPNWETQVETLPANRTLQLALLAKCAGLVVVSTANNKLHEWVHTAKHLKKAGISLPLDVTRDLKLAANSGFEFVCLCWLVEKMETIAAIGNLEVRRIKLAPVLEGIKQKRYKPSASMVAALKVLEDTLAPVRSVTVE